ncbi:MAG: succinate dehydrogenase, cytochrome b556 subunit [Rickettsiales bacterium]|nr:succinate dehydrogenase, cytochrome b556 subunit [Rickettsiales bacterium]
MTKTTSSRPLSPHLQIYKPQMTSILSIFHRMTGFALSLGLLPLTCWLYHAAYNPAGLDGFYDMAGSVIGMLFLFGWSVAFYYHLANGIRHLIWDAGMMLEIEDAQRGGFLVLGVTLGLTAATWIYVLMGGTV